MAWLSKKKALPKTPSFYLRAPTILNNFHNPVPLFLANLCYRQSGPIQQGHPGYGLIPIFCKSLQLLKSDHLGEFGDNVNVDHLPSVVRGSWLRVVVLVSLVQGCVVVVCCASYLYCADDTWQIYRKCEVREIRGKVQGIEKVISRLRPGEFLCALRQLFARTNLALAYSLSGKRMHCPRPPCPA